jgi:hypothetical protein
MQDGMAYVMLGRPERLEDLYITEDFDPSEIKCDEKYSLPESKRLDTVYDDIENSKKERRDKCWKVSYLNVRSLKSADGHREDVASDDIIMGSDMFGLGETWLDEDVQVNYDEFHGYFANFGNGKGVASYSKIDLDGEPEIVASETFSAICFKTKQFCIIFLYLSSNFKTNDLFAYLDKWIENDIPTAVIGDINQNIWNMRKASFANKMRKSKGFHQLINKPTCDSGSLIDHLYVNDAMKALGISTDIDAAYYSDHDIISLYIPKHQ